MSDRVNLSHGEGRLRACAPSEAGRVKFPNVKFRKLPRSSA